MENNVIERRAIFAGTTFENKIPPQFLRPKIRFLVESLIRGKPASRLCWGGFTLLHWGWFIASPTHFETNPSVFLRAGGSKVNTYRKTKYNVLPRNKSMSIPHTGGSWTNTHPNQIPPKIPFRRIWPNEEPLLACNVYLTLSMTGHLLLWHLGHHWDTRDTIGTLSRPTLQLMVSVWYKGYKRSILAAMIVCMRNNLGSTYRMIHIHLTQGNLKLLR